MNGTFTLNGFDFVGYSEADQMLYVVATEKEEDAWRIISARRATKQEKKRYEKTNAFHER